ncbi:MAG: DUF4199 domain-containing protein [Bacteroidales bacterium]|jgi:hypothetical protein|nr:DUF4199 domain-containing protein [Bacteroidales bacterium]
MNIKFNIILKWALLLGIGTSLLQLFKSLTYNLKYFSYGSFVDLFLVLIFIGALYMAIKEYRDNVKGGKIKFSEAFGVALGMTAITFALFFIFQIVHYNVIDKNGLSKINERNQNKFVERVEKDTVNTRELELYVEFVKQQIDSNSLLLQTHLDCLAEVGNRLIVIKDFYPTRLLNRNLADSAQLLVKNIDRYAQKILIDLTETVIREKKMDDSCELLLTEIIGNTLEKIRKEYSMQDNSLKQSEPKPIVYTNVYAASFTFSLSILIYGLFFGLFVSLYLYKRENKQFAPDSESENGENLE